MEFLGGKEIFFLNILKLIKYFAGRDVKGEKVELTNLTREEGGLYVCTADNGVTAPVERVTRILVRRKEHIEVHFIFTFPYLISMV